MTYLAEPSGQRLQATFRNLGYKNEIFQATNKKSVQLWLKECQRRRHEEEELVPICLKIIDEEVRRLAWGDECFDAYVLKMFKGADISQLQSFYSRYNRTRNRTAFFLSFVRNEL